MSIIRNRVKSKYSQIPNELLTDNQLSFGARIVMCYLLSKPDEWIITNKDIKKQLDIKQDHTIAKYLKELIHLGWIFRERNKNQKGQFDDYIYTLHTSKPKEIQTHYEDDEEDLIVEKPHIGNESLIVGIPHVVTPILGQNHSLNNIDINNSNTDNSNTICGTNVPLAEKTVKKNGLKAKENNNDVVKIYNHWEQCLNKTYDRTSDTYKARLQTIKRALAKYSYQTIADVIEFKATSKYTKSYELSAMLGNFLSQNIEKMEFWLFNDKKHVDISFDDFNNKKEEEKRVYKFDDDGYDD